MAEDREKEAGGGRNVRRGPVGLLLRFKFVITIIIIIGLVVHLALVYNTAQQLDVTGVGVEKVEPDTDGTYTITLVILVDNPTRTSVEVDRLTYEVHLEGDFIGEGEKTFFEVASGEQRYSFDLTFDPQDLAGPTYTLFTQETATLVVEGEVTIPAKVFGLWTYTRITVPYSEEKEVDAGGGGNGGPDLPPSPVILGPAIYQPTNSARLTWSQNGDDDFASYEVHASKEPAFVLSNETRVATIAEQDTTEHTVTGLDHLTTYYFAVRVYDLGGKHSDSNVVSAFIP